MADRIAPTDAPSAAGEALVETLTRFGRELRGSGIPVGSGDLVTYCEAVALLDPGDLLDLYWAGRTTLVTGHDQIPIYDRVFRCFFLGGATRLPEPVRRAVERSVVATEAVIEVPATEPWRRSEEGEEARLGLAASDIEIWRHKSFAACTEEELAAVSRIIHSMRMIPPRRRTRRTAPSRAGNRPDLRRTVRAAMRTHGDPSLLHWRRRTLKPRPMVLILDVSGSMADYSRNLLQFAYSARQAAKVEVFCFGTRLTRITRALERRRPDQALDEAAQVVFDWEGGTRIGHAIDTFVRRWGRKRMSRGTIVMICSDGLDRGDPALLSHAMERLARLSHRIVWVNPHKGDDPAWRPSTLGMMVAEPHIDLLLSGHDLASLEAITEQLPALR